jgi:hypothetical protein
LIDQSEKFCPVARFYTIQSVLSVAATEKLHMEQFDAKTAFLYGLLDEELYTLQPEGFDDGTNRVCKLKRSLYRLRQSPRCWNRRLVDCLNKLGFAESNADSCLYVLHKDGHKLIVVLYVDDGIIAATHLKTVRNLLMI